MKEGVANKNSGENQYSSGEYEPEPLPMAKIMDEDGAEGFM
jgi:hypothetical protein